MRESLISRMFLGSESEEPIHEMECIIKDTSREWLWILHWLLDDTLSMYDGICYDLHCSSLISRTIQLICILQIISSMRNKSSHRKTKITSISISESESLKSLASIYRSFSEGSHISNWTSEAVCELFSSLDASYVIEKDDSSSEVVITGGAGIENPYVKFVASITGVEERDRSWLDVTTAFLPWVKIQSMVCLCNVWMARGTRTSVISISERLDETLMRRVVPSTSITASR